MTDDYANGRNAAGQTFEEEEAMRQMGVYGEIKELKQQLLAWADEIDRACPHYSACSETQYGCCWPGHSIARAMREEAE